MNESTKVFLPSYTLSWSHLYIESRTSKFSRCRKLKTSEESSSLVLRDLTGFARPGEVLAIMGTSGVGTYLSFIKLRNTEFNE